MCIVHRSYFLPNRTCAEKDEQQNLGELQVRLKFLMKQVGEKKTECGEAIASVWQPERNDR